MDYQDDSKSSDYVKNEVRKFNQEVNQRFFKLMGIAVPSLAVLMGVSYLVANFGYAGHGEFYQRHGVTKQILSRSDKERYHEINLAHEGFVAKVGAIEYILDKDGRPLTPPLYNIRITESGFYSEMDICKLQFDKKGAVINQKPVNCLDELIDR